MKLSAILSPLRLKRTAVCTVRRFPIACILFGLWTIYQLLYIWDVVNFERLTDEALNWSLLLGFGLSTALTLLIEMTGGKRYTKPLQIATVIITAVYLWIYISEGNGGEAGNIGRFALVCGIATLIIFGPAGHAFTRRQATAYTLLQVRSWGCSYGLSAVLGIAIAIIFISISILFNINSDKPVFTAVLLFCGLLSVFVWLRMMPRRRSVEIMSDVLPILPAKIIRAILLPITVIYMAVLYVYMFKIIFTWELPDGQLSWMVSICTAAVLVTLFFLQPLAWTGDKISTIARRLLPALLLPLTLLMTYGLCYRFAQYGITAWRIYVALFAAWSIWAELYLTIRTDARLNLIATVFAGCFILVSVIPGCNVSSITNAVMRSELKRTFAGHTLPLSINQARSILKAMPEQDALNTASKLEYLDQWNDHSAVADIVSYPAGRLTEYQLLDRDDLQTVVEYHVMRYRGPVAIPAGYTDVCNFEVAYNSWKNDMRTDSTDTYIMKINSEAHFLTVNRAELTAADEASLPINVQISADSLAVITYLDPANKERLEFDRIEGLLFTK